jgi:hypothetical protein
MINNFGHMVKPAIAGLLFLGLLSGNALASDEFEKVRCGADIPRALIGRHTANQTVAMLEHRYQALALKDLGADEISGHLSSVSWSICRREYMLLIDRDVVRDVLPFPPHSKSAPAFSGICQIKSKNVPDIVVAVLNDTPGHDALVPIVAWKIDQSQTKFVKMPTEGLLCPRGGIFTADGGP